MLKKNKTEKVDLKHHPTTKSSQMDDKQIQEILAFADSWQDFDEDIFSIDSIEQRRRLSKRVD